MIVADVCVASMDVKPCVCVCSGLARLSSQQVAGHRLGAWLRLGEASADVQVLSFVVWARVLNNGMASLRGGEAQDMHEPTTNTLEKGIRDEEN